MKKHKWQQKVQSFLLHLTNGSVTNSGKYTLKNSTENQDRCKNTSRWVSLAGLWTGVCISITLNILQQTFFKHVQLLIKSFDTNAWLEKEHFCLFVLNLFLNVFPWLLLTYWVMINIEKYAKTHVYYWYALSVMCRSIIIYCSFFSLFKYLKLYNFAEQQQKKITETPHSHHKLFFFFKKKTTNPTKRKVLPFQPRCV